MKHRYKERVSSIQTKIKAQRKFSNIHRTDVEKERARERERER